MDKFEKLVLEIMADAEKDGEPITREEAEEMARMELGAKEIKNYTQADVEKKERKPKERKVDTEKLFLLETLSKGLVEELDIHINYENEVKLHFNYNDNDYSVTLTKHRPKKG